MPNIMQVPQGVFRLNRFPLIKNETLRAWDAADEYLLNYLNENYLSDKPLKILIINDNFGALAVALAGVHDITLWSDSYLSRQGVAKNLKANSVQVINYKFLSSTVNPQGNFDIVLMKVPKSYAFLEDQLCRLLSVLDEKTIFISAAMSKNIHSSTLEYFEKIVGNTKTSLAVKKARLIFTATDQLDKNKKSPYPKCYQFDGFNYDICDHSNVFSREKLDIGTRFFLQQIPSSERFSNIVDMGCGNGLLGLSAAEKNTQASVVFVDESYMAVESAKNNFESSGLNNKSEFYAMDCLSDLQPASADLILNNPPFHQQHATGDAVAWRMFNDAKKGLKKGGELWVIGNRHLAYHIKLKKIFNNCETVSSNNKFTIYKSVKNIN